MNIESINQDSGIYERLINKMEVSDSGCWDWLGWCDRDGYGHFSLNMRKKLKAHRLSYELHKGAIPKDLTIDHLCRNRKCCNPDHLEAVTRAENNRRGVGIARMQAFHKNLSPERAKAMRKAAAKKASTKRRSKTSCKHGHLFSPDNTYVAIKSGHRSCKTCREINSTKSNLKKKMKIKEKALCLGNQTHT